MSLSRIAQTALLTAAARAVESRRADALFRDPWADRFAGDAGRAMLERTGSPRPTLALAVRTRYFDDVALGAFAAGVHTAASLACGFDMRPARLAAPAVRWFDVDTAETLAHKRKTLGSDDAAAKSRAVAVDITGDFAAPLVAAGFEPSAPALLLAEGLVMYLPPEDALRFIERVGALMATGSVFAFDVPSPSALDRAGTMARHNEELARAGAAWRFATAHPAELFDAQTFDVDVVHIGHPRAHFGRLSEPPCEAPTDGAVTWLVTARRR